MKTFSEFHENYWLGLWVILCCLMKTSSSCLFCPSRILNHGIRGHAILAKDLFLLLKFQNKDLLLSRTVDIKG